MERESQWAVSLECSKFGEEVPQLVVPAGRAQASPEVKLDFAPVHLPADLHVEIASVQTARNGLDLDPGLLTLHRFPKTKLAYSTGLSGASSSGKSAPSMAESQRAWQSSSRRRARRDLETRVSDRRAGRSRYEAVCGRWFKGTQSVPSRALFRRDCTLSALRSNVWAQCHGADVRRCGATLDSRGATTRAAAPASGQDPPAFELFAV